MVYAYLPHRRTPEKEEMVKQVIISPNVVEDGQSRSVHNSLEMQTNEMFAFRKAQKPRRVKRPNAVEDGQSRSAKQNKLGA